MYVIIRLKGKSKYPKEIEMKYPIEKRQVLYRIMDDLKNKKTAKEVRQFAVNIAIIMEEELPFKMMMNEAACFKPLFLSTSKRWMPQLSEIRAAITDCLKYY
jgi:hypothetical protein